jgi:hypothetical protein
MLLKQDSEIRSSDIKEIKQALLGNDLNGFRGLVWKISDIDNRVTDLEDNDNEIKVYIKQAKFVVAAFTAALVTLILKHFLNEINSEGYRLITKFEGFSAKPYLCSAKVPTIGYGNTYYTNGKK